MRRSADSSGNGEQLAEAYAVQVVLGERSVGGEANAHGDPDG